MAQHMRKYDSDSFRFAGAGSENLKIFSFLSLRQEDRKAENFKFSLPAPANRNESESYFRICWAIVRSYHCPNLSLKVYVYGHPEDIKEICVASEGGS